MIHFFKQSDIEKEKNGGTFFSFFVWRNIIRCIYGVMPGSKVYNVFNKKYGALINTKFWFYSEDCDTFKSGCKSETVGQEFINLGLRMMIDCRGTIYFLKIG